MEGIAIDILGPLPETPQINKLILVVSHNFTKWTEIYTMPNQETTTVAEKRASSFVASVNLVIFIATKELTLSQRCRWQRLAWLKRFFGWD